MTKRILILVTLLTFGMIFSTQPVYSASTSTAKNSSQVTSQISGTININSADVDALTQLPGIGKKTAQKIVDYRNKNGKFSSPEALMNVKGIGQKKYDKLKSHLSV